MISFDKEDIFLVTGASSGIGRAAALQINSLGGTVIINGRNSQRLEEVKNKAKYPENVIIEIRDLSSDIEHHDEWVINLAKKYGKLKGIVLSAGISYVRPLGLIDYENIVESQNILLNAPVMLMKGFANRKANNGNAVAVVISAFAAHKGVKSMLEYSSAKSALITASKVMANELYLKNIRVNSVSPGLIDTPMVEKSIEKGETNKDLLQYAGKPEYVANVISFLLSDLSCWIRGQDIIVDGGASLPNIFNKF